MPKEQTNKELSDMAYEACSVEAMLMVSIGKLQETLAQSFDRSHNASGDYFVLEKIGGLYYQAEELELNLMTSINRLKFRFYDHSDLDRESSAGEGLSYCDFTPV